ncbi:unnamed protein product (macronuclear) [Paramecium tetraurelia]|uniref:Uncharacterized protein n=1 Tax=Paramecium tetraurelia TaxID=5888 RepID=A0BLA8_PARTE|nr:uncharacterized protein GSPATT00029957001 [Paramecium tetraurelia]CAK59325.1 unnamed protein product [Paramecium tetraurelia]|eukprot:XP_001426723.1 hypothetical protein (macronuclear) [Paramecium tetraurelia strain d4-2]
MQLAILALCIIEITTYDYWGNAYTAFDSTDIADNDGWLMHGNNGNVFNSTCGTKSLFGGFNILGAGASVSKIISLPAHFKVRVSLEFWKIDSWDEEILYIILDNNVTTDHWYWSTGDMICGNVPYWSEWKEVQKNFSIEFKHNQPTLAVIITTTLDEVPLTESWGFRNFKVDVLYCAPGCIICNEDGPDQCWYYAQIEKNWFGTEDFNTDGWTLNTYNSPTYSTCVNINVIGGIGQFTQATELQKQYTSLDPHFKLMLQVQVWKFDVWTANSFTIEIDGQNAATAIFNKDEVTQLCGNSGGGERLLNIEIIQTHTADSMLIKMKSDLSSTAGSWGLRAFSLLLGKCYEKCLTCSGPNYDNCQSCKTGYFLLDSQCDDVKWILGLQQYFLPQDFQIQTGWTISNVYYNRNPFQLCNGQNLVGGTQLLAKDASITLSFELPRHTKIRIKLQLWKFDSWDNEWFRVFADGTQVYQLQIGLNGALILCGTYSTSSYVKNLDFNFLHNQQSIILMMTSTLDEPADNEAWGIRNFQLFYGVPKDCSNSVVDSVTLPSFIGTKCFQTIYYSTDHTLQNKIEITELGLSLQSIFDQNLSVDSAIKQLTILIEWNCFSSDQTFSISILQSSFPDYKKATVYCKQKRSNLLKSTVILQRTIIQTSTIRLVATSTKLQIQQTVDGQTTTQYEMIIN